MRRNKLVVVGCALVLLVGVGWWQGADLIRETRTMNDATAAFKAGEYTTAVRLAEPIAELGNPEAATWMGMAYAFGLGVPRDRDRARAFYLSAQGERASKSFYWVAEQFDRGASSVPIDHAEALAWYAAAAEMGDRRAQRVLARVFRDGLYGVYPDQNAAQFWARRAGDE